MSIDYKYTIRRKADGKKIASFYFNLIKSLHDVSCYPNKLKLDPNDVTTDSSHPIRYEFSYIQDDICTLKNENSNMMAKIHEKKMMIPLCTNTTIKLSIEDEIQSLNEMINMNLDAIEALAGLNATITVLVEDLINNDDAGAECLAYCYNAHGLPKTDKGYDPTLWTHDIYVEAIALC